MKKFLLLLAAPLLLISCEVKLPETTDFAVTPQSLSVGSDGGSVTFNVYCDGKVSVSVAKDCDWARITSPATFESDAAVEVEVDENKFTKRKTVITVSYKDGLLSQDVTLSQAGLTAYLEVLKDDIRITATAAVSTEVEVSTNVPSVSASVEYKDDQKDWIKDVTVSSGKLSFNTPVGFDTPQNAVITLSYTDEIVGTISAKVAVLLSDKDGYFEAGPHTEISTAAQLASFLSGASTLGADAAYTLGADIDLKDVTLSPAASFAGSFSGNKHKILNWTATDPLFTTLSGTVSDLIIDASCTYVVAASGDAAFIAGSNTGTVRDCTNNGGIACRDSSVFPASRNIASIVAENKGTVMGCVNTGKIEIVTQAFYQAPLWLGGVVAKTSASDASAASVKDCRNEGALILSVDRCKSPIFVGGVVGGTPSEMVAAQYSSAGLENYGIVSGCTNTGNVTVKWKENTNPMLNVNLGGVAGYIQGSLTACENKAALSFKAPTDGSWSIKHASFGGVAGFVLNSVTRCNNSGDITLEGIFGGGTVDSGVGASYNPSNFFGGVVGMAGPNDSTNESVAISECNNNGAVEVTAKMLAAGKPNFYFGGVVAYAKAPVSNCSNTKSFTAHSNAQHKFIGGICGQSSFAVSGCTNSGELTVDNIVTADGDSYSQDTHFGGICGFHAVSSINQKIQNCNNSGALYFKAGPKGSTAINTVGGICGQCLGEIHGGSVETACGNTGAIYYQGDTRAYIGGICGYSAAKILYMNNSGNVNVPGTGNAGGLADKSMVGGFVGVGVHQISLSLDGGASTAYGAKAKNVGYVGNQTGNVTVHLQSACTACGVGLLLGKLNAAGGGKYTDDAGEHSFCNYHSSTLSGAVTVTGGTTVKAAIYAGAGFGTYNSLSVGIISGISDTKGVVLKAPISINGTTITADNYKDYLAYGQNNYVVTTYTKYE